MEPLNSSPVRLMRCETGQKLSMLKPGTVFDKKYEIVRHIGAGGFAHVYEAIDRELSRSVALKILHHNVEFNDIDKARFKQEARLIAKLNHPGIIQCYRIDESDGTLFICMELFASSSLAQLIADDALHWRDSVKICIQAARALQVAHDVGIAHRDVSPKNILVQRASGGDSFVVKIVDFGLAKEMNNGQALTVGGTAVGSLHYMSPEQCMGERADARSDVYSLGAVLYQSITGTPMFVLNTVEENMHAHVCEEPVPPSARKDFGEAGSALDTVITKAVAKQPDHRYATMADFAADLETLLAGGNIRQLALASCVGGTDVKGGMRRQLIFAGLAAGLVLIATTSFAVSSIMNQKQSSNNLSSLSRTTISQLDKFDTEAARKNDLEMCETTLANEAAYFAANPRKFSAFIDSHNLVQVISQLKAGTPPDTWFAALNDPEQRCLVYLRAANCTASGLLQHKLLDVAYRTGALPNFPVFCKPEIGAYLLLRAHHESTTKATERAKRTVQFLRCQRVTCQDNYQTMIHSKLIEARFLEQEQRFAEACDKYFAVIDELQQPNEYSAAFKAERTVFAQLMAAPLKLKLGDPKAAYTLIESAEKNPACKRSQDGVIDYPKLAADHKAEILRVLSQ